MATRSAVRIAGRFAGNLDLYRHWDGYPAAAGADLLVAIAGASGAEELAARLLVMSDGGRPQYEITDSTQHGDLEHVYIVTRSAAGVWEIMHVTRPGWDVDADWTSWPTRALYSLPGFVSMVNQDRQAINRRLAELRRKHPGQDLGSDYAMVEAVA